jgi:hypothetical protein
VFGILPTRIHGLLDYLMGTALVVIPLAFQFGAGAQTWLPVLLGGGVIVYSLLTDYELGVVELIAMPAHLFLDALGGLLLAASPWLFGFAWEIWVPHVVLGLAEVGAALFTRTRPSRGVSPEGRLGASA